MYMHRRSFTKPRNLHVKVWRYMDFTKFVSLLDSRCLHFTRTDKFDDPFEGSWPRTNVELRQKLPVDIPQEKQAGYIQSTSTIGPLSERYRRFVFLNCWHINEYESAAMWTLYLKNDVGVAVQSTYSRLREAFTGRDAVYLGPVRYIDYNRDIIDMPYGYDTLRAYMHKRKSFEHEREIRAVVTKEERVDGEIEWGSNVLGGGLKQPVNVGILIESVHVAPTAPDWFLDLVKSIVAKYGYNFTVYQSELNEGPIF